MAPPTHSGSGAMAPDPWAITMAWAFGDSAESLSGARRPGAAPTAAGQGERDAPPAFDVA